MQHLKRRAKMEARGTYTMPEAMQKQLKAIAFGTGKPESHHVRNALQLYFEKLQSKSTVNPEVRG